MHIRKIITLRPSKLITILNYITEMTDMIANTPMAEYKKIIDTNEGKVWIRKEAAAQKVETDVKHTETDVKHTETDVKHTETNVSGICIDGVIVEDPIYGVYSLPRVIGDILEHKYFRRLADICQLGNYVYINPNASHTRLFHSMGVAYLAWEAANLPQHNKLLRTIAAIAGLCHDIGHSAFSHTFDHILSDMFDEGKLPGAKKEQIRHEYRSVRLTHLLLTDISKDYPWLTQEVIYTCCMLIDPISTPILLGMSTPTLLGMSTSPPIKSGLELYGIDQMINNTENKIDVDRLDYIARDMYRIGIHTIDETIALTGGIVDMLRSGLVYYSEAKHKHIWMFPPSFVNFISGILDYRTALYVDHYHTIEAVRIESSVTEIIHLAIRILGVDISSALLQTAEDIDAFCSITDRRILESLGYGVALDILNSIPARYTVDVANIKPGMSFDDHLKYNITRLDSTAGCQSHVAPVLTTIDIVDLAGNKLAAKSITSKI